MPKFIPALKLNEQFYAQIIRPILQNHFNGLIHAAARLGSGSEVLGYDTPMSTDHDWGLQLQLFLNPDDFKQHGDAIKETLRHQLPPTFKGYSTHFGKPDEEGVRHMAETNGLIEHRIEVWTISDFFENYMACNPHQEPTVYDWLTWPQQHLLGVTKGQIYADEWGDLSRIRHTLSYFPHEVWLYLLACQWARIGEEEAFVGRAGDLGDELGSAVLAARLVHDLMQLCFLMEKTYAPYPKWFGIAFSKLACASEMTPILEQVLVAKDWHTRERHLCAAYELAARMHNDLGITKPVATTVRLFHGRPFQVIYADRFVTPIKKAISNPIIRKIDSNIGSIDQFSHSTNLRSYPRLHRRLQTVYNGSNGKTAD